MPTSASPPLRHLRDLRGIALQQAELHAWEALAKLGDHAWQRVACLGVRGRDRQCPGFLIAEFRGRRTQVVRILQDSLDDRCECPARLGELD